MMPPGKDQHSVPQMMIRRFAGVDGKLVELVKPKLQIGTRQLRTKRDSLRQKRLPRSSIGFGRSPIYANRADLSYHLPITGR